MVDNYKQTEKVEKTTQIHSTNDVYSVLTNTFTLSVALLANNLNIECKLTKVQFRHVCSPCNAQLMMPYWCHH